MRKLLLLVFTLVLSFTLSSCQKNEKTYQEGSDVFHNYYKSADIDLTNMSSTMVYSQVSDMMQNPSKYYGKTIKVEGRYYRSYFDMTDNYYHYIIVADALACCSQGIEFLWNGNHSLDDFPTVDSTILLVGRFTSYDELGITYNVIELL